MNTSAAIKVADLRKDYRGTRAVDAISFDVPHGSITGFLGPNGAGKSTTLRMLVGLTAPTGGSATVLGRHYTELVNPGRRVGVLLDASAQHSGRTGLEVLRLGAMMMGLPDRRAEEMIEKVGLSAAESRRRTGTYSLGMRQRLGVAHALLGDPSVLILDEPANGLDPAGIHWMRTLLKEFADAGGSVLLSSHLLHEIEVVADELVVIGRGRIVARGAKNDLLAGSGVAVRSTDDEGLAAAMRAAGVPFTDHPDGGFTVSAAAEHIANIAAAAGITLRELRTADDGGLEQLFLRLTADDAREDVRS
ncbi:ABC-2 type transport system ATP-binding protein [Catenulispora sp. GAS73]|uniref:ATP-binding cassette domain-containing protein n=1 Tax=Catenulispora sp. GAS73 TaxID=3156269 RepID=UPI0035118B50